MNEYFDKGKEVQKKFKYHDIYGEFEKYYEEVLSSATTAYAVEFVRGILDKTKNETMFMYARTIAEYQNCEHIWALLISTFNSIIKGKRKPSWAYEFVSSTINYSKIKLFNYQAELLVTMILTYNNEYMTWWFKPMKDRPWFDELKPYMLTALLGHLDKISSENMKTVLNEIKEQTFYFDVMRKTKDPKMFSEVLLKYKDYEFDIEGFIGGIDITYMLKEFEDKFINNESAMMYISSIIRKNYYTSETGKLFVDILEKGPWVDTRKTMWLKKIDHIGSIEVNLKLLELTGDIRYAPEEAKNIFLF